MSKNPLNLPDDPPTAKGATRDPGATPDDVRALAKQFTVEAIEGLYAIASDTDNAASARLAAWTALLDRGHGRVINEAPPPPTNQYNDNRTVINVTEQALRAIPQEKLLELRAQVMANDAGNDKNG